jgi:predicted dehydrogenase
MKTRFAFVGFRHNHIFDLLAGVREQADCELVACCEEDARTREALATDERVSITHADFTAMLHDVECEVIAIGDTYDRRGELAIQALRAGRHVLSDKPLCHTLAEQAHLEDLVGLRKLSVGLQLDCRGAGPFIRLREIIAEGLIGEVATVHVGGQHPLSLGTRPAWYFEPERHGGTINDIGIHAFDLVPWLTGQPWEETVAARSWNAKAEASPHFHDCAQLLGSLKNGAGVIADFSYLAPDKAGAQLPQYWRVTVHGTRGMAETHLRADSVTLVEDHYEGPDQRPAAPALPRRYLRDFLEEIRGNGEAADLRTSDCLLASRLAVTAQRKATA